MYASECLKVIIDQCKRLIDCLTNYPLVTLKFIDIPLISVSKWNKVSDIDILLGDNSISNQIKSVNLRIRNLNRDLEQNTLRFNTDCLT